MNNPLLWLAVLAGALGVFMVGASLDRAAAVMESDGLSLVNQGAAEALTEYVDRKFGDYLLEVQSSSFRFYETAQTEVLRAISATADVGESTNELVWFFNLQLHRDFWVGLSLAIPSMFVFWAVWRFTNKQTRAKAVDMAYTEARLREKVGDDEADALIEKSLQKVKGKAK